MREAFDPARGLWLAREPRELQRAWLRLGAFDAWQVDSLI
jgi:hypothetical protein